MWKGSQPEKMPDGWNLDNSVRMTLGVFIYSYPYSLPDGSLIWHLPLSFDLGRRGPCKHSISHLKTVPGTGVPPSSDFPQMLEMSAYEDPVSFQGSTLELARTLEV